LSVALSSIRAATAAPDSIQLFSAFPSLSTRLSRRLLLAGFLSASCLLALQEAARAETAQSASLQPWAGGSHPNFSLKTLGGGTENLVNHANRIVVVHFFATWCEPCRREIGSLQDLSKRLPQDRFSIIGVDVAEVEIRVRRFFDSLPVTFPIALDRDGAVAKAWDVNMLPTTFVLGRDQSPRFYVQGDLDWNHPDIDRLLIALENETPKKRNRRTSTLERTNQQD